MLFLVLGGRELATRRIDPDEPVEADESEPTTGRGETAERGESNASGGGGSSASRPGVAAQPVTSQRVTVDQVITLVAFLIVAVVALAFDRNIGFTAITAAVILTALFPPGWL